MIILEADYILTCNEKFDILENSAVCFDKKIIEVDKSKKICNKYPDAKYIKLPKNSVLMPGLINVHTHLEFSSNKTLLEYGSFIPWLKSVIEKKDDVSAQCSDDVMDKELKNMLLSGTTSIGAISSNGYDMEVCAKSPMRVVYFNEILGSSPNSVDILFEDFKQRLRHSQELENERFIPAISVHSPYSTHPILAKNALYIARENSLLVSTHFMESLAERKWLDEGKGEFLDFFKPFETHAKPFINANEYIELFQGCKTLFTHCVHANNQELESIASMGGVVTHCPRSNRLLSAGLLDVKSIFNKNISFTLGTDGLSSNISLSLWDELRTSLFVHRDIDLHILAKKLLLSVTREASDALRLNAGQLRKEKEADIISFTLPQKIQNIDQLPLQSILHVEKVDQIYIQGEDIANH